MRRFSVMTVTASFWIEAHDYEDAVYKAFGPGADAIGMTGAPGIIIYEGLNRLGTVSEIRETAEDE